MLEILALIILFKKLRVKLEAKNRSKWLAWLGPVLWFSGQFFGGIIGAIIFLLLGGSEDNTLAFYGISFFCGILGVLVAFLIVKLMPPKAIYCPNCNHSYLKISQWGKQCEGCDSMLKLVNGKIQIIKKA